MLNLSFLLGVAGRKYKTGELRFPAMDTFPLFTDFKPLLFVDTFPQLEKISYKTRQLNRLAGIQLFFTEGFISPLFQTKNAQDNEVKSILVDTTKQIRSISLLIYTGVYYEGIRLFDEQGNAVVDVQWNEFEMG